MTESRMTATMTPPRSSSLKRNGEFHYRWEYRFRSSPQQLWRAVSNTNRFNRDAAVPQIEVRDSAPVNARRRLKMHRFTIAGIRLIPIEWEEEPFEWLEPHHFGVIRRYSKGPLKEMRVYCELTPTEDGGTFMTYETWAEPNGLFGTLATPIQIGILSRFEFARAFHHYDDMAQINALPEFELGRMHLAPGGKARIASLRQTLLRNGADESLLERLIALIERGDELTVMRLRPYALADAWGVDRRAVLELCLMATRVGLLNFRWELLCPLCRGAKGIADHLSDIERHVHCEVCNIDFDINFDQAVELTFHPNASVRVVEDIAYCVGGPQVTPHILMQELLLPEDRWSSLVDLQPGRYRVRALDLKGGHYIQVTPDGETNLHLAIVDRMQGREIAVAPQTFLTVENQSGGERLVILERMQWTDQIVTAAEVTSMQLFRDLFAQETLRPDIQIEVASLTLVFTDLKGSSRLYAEVGDAPAFGMVLNHFDILREVIAAEDGAIVKTLGDAVMAVFKRPVNALRAVLRAQEILAAAPMEYGGKPLQLKAGIHTGKMIAVTLNDRLDYFGTTVNVAARLAALSQGTDIIASEAVFTDPEVADLLNQRDFSLMADVFDASLKGFESEQFRLSRIRSTSLVHSMSL